MHGSMYSVRRTSRLASATRLVTMLAVAGMAIGASSRVAAQTPEFPSNAIASRAGGAMDGRDFAGLRLTSPVQLTNLVISGTNAWTWEEGASATGTQRIHLEGDARVDLGQYQFTASQAVVWIEQIDDAAQPVGTPGADSAETGEEPKKTYQIAVYFDRVSDPGAPSGEGGLSQAGDRLLVTGVIQGSISLRSDVVRPFRPAAPFLSEAEARLGRFLAAASGAPEEEGPSPDRPLSEFEGGAARRVYVRDPIDPGVSRPYSPGSRFAPDSFEPSESIALPARQPAPIFASRGIITVAFSQRLPDQSINYIPYSDTEYVAVFDSPVVMVYSDRRSGRTLQVSAQRAAVFTPPLTGPDAPVGGVQSEASKVNGVYLEGDVVATDGQYTLRGDRIYYDVVGNKATILNAVFWTYDEKRGLPLYLRAKSIKQLSDKQWTANDAKLATTSFFEPHFSLGLTSVTVTNVERSSTPNADGSVQAQNQTLVDAKGITLRAGGIPFFWLPRFAGDVQHFPLRSIRVDSSSGSGAGIKTTWDIYSLLGLDRPENLEANLLIDGYFDRGAALGTDLGWRSASAQGDLLAYTLLSDNGTDHLSSGARVDQDGDTRGLIIGEHRWTIDDTWTLFLEGSYVSDETFVDAFFRPLGQSRREFANSAYIQAIDGATAFSAEVRGQLNDFTPNQYLLESLGYNTEKLPEASYSRLNDDLLSGLAPGLLTYQSEYRLSRLQLNFTEPTARELGFTNDARAREAFGLLPDESLGDRLRARGLTEDAVLRFDTRHELSSPLKAGPVNITPFTTLRVTGYDRDFSDYSPDSDEQIRLWGGAGVRTGTEIVRVDNSVNSRFFDLHRIRHIIQPTLTLWTSGTNLDQNDLPVYDDDVESLASGSVFKAGVKQTWQTQRGGPGRYRSVDFITLNTEIVESSNDADRESPIGRFFDYRPEYSLLGDYATVDAVIQLSDSVAVTANTIYDFEINQPARTSAGGTIQHSRDFSTFAEMRYLNARDVTLVDFGANYKITPKYSVSGYVTFDTDESDVQSVATTIRRRFPVATLGVTLRYNNISSESSVGVVFEPNGKDDRAAELRRRLGPESKDYPVGDDQ